MDVQDYTPYMREAIREAEKSRFKTWPNPAVGAVLVRAGKIVARGRHRRAGLPHAEIECLKDAREKNVDPTGATMVVTLEPCVHYGKTPPCVDALLEAGIACLVYGASDPNPAAHGGAQKLADAGVHVIGPVLKQECEDLIADFKIWQTENRPYIILKLAGSLDGRIATRAGESRWISCEEARKDVHALRTDIGKAGGAILVGGTTFRADNPELTARFPANNDLKQALACVITSRLPRADADFVLLKKRANETIFFTSPAASVSITAEALRKLGCRVFPVAMGPNGICQDFEPMFRELREGLNCPYTLCEGGGRLALALLEAHLVDEFHLYLAPIVLGDNEARPIFTGRRPVQLDEALKMRFCQTDFVGKDLRMVLRPLNIDSGN